jgi:hypothetical protein
MSINKKELPNQGVVPPEPPEAPEPGDDIIFERELSSYQLRLWKNLSPAPRREFPNFSTNAGKTAELEIIKKTLRAKVDGYGLDLKTSGDQCAPGMHLGPKDNPGAAIETIPKNDIEEFIGGLNMGAYFEEALHGGVSHDVNDNNGKMTGWLPGLFVIDEIFKALCSELQVMIDAANNGVAGAQNTLTAFVNRISSTADGDPEAANKYRRFINYETQDNGELSDDQKTYIKLVRTSAGDFITGAIIHINDWAEGTHSSGAAHK